LFDAVAAALGVSRESVSYEGQAAIELEELARRGLGDAAAGYSFARSSMARIKVLDAGPMWDELLDDLVRQVPLPIIAARFHLGLAAALAEMALELCALEGLGTVALSGGVFQNRILFEAVANHLREGGVGVLTHHLVPANDGGLSLGQAVAAAVLLERGEGGIDISLGSPICGKRMGA
jgi:hydrogenase maturation protein HypF